MIQTPDNFIPLLTPPASKQTKVLNFLFKGDEFLIHETDLSMPDQTVVASLGLAGEHFHPLGSLDQTYVRVASLDSRTQAPAGYRFSKMRALFTALDLPTLALAGRAFQVAEWARTHQYCGACAAPMNRTLGDRSYRCSQCSFMAYPRISPAMMVLVRKGASILLARNIAGMAQRFSALAGFVEAGESIEECVHREVFEEVGLRVNRLQYFGSQAWAFPHSLMIAFTAEYVSGEIHCAADEIAEARWVGPGDPVPEFLRGVSISGELISANLPGNVAT
jgi:NAD+ diphosphatase